jgi:Putative zinc ribbon domain
MEKIVTDTGYCESCMMPFAKDTGKREDPRYCSLCFHDGRLCYEGDDLEEFQQAAYESMRKNGTNVLLAKFYTWMIRFAPRWKKK